MERASVTEVATLMGRMDLDQPVDLIRHCLDKGLTLDECKSLVLDVKALLDRDHGEVLNPPRSWTYPVHPESRRRRERAVH